MIKQYTLSEAGMGDVVIFISYLRQFFNSNTEIEIDIDKQIIDLYMGHPNEYYEFIKDFAKFLCSDNISVKENLRGEKISVTHLPAIYSQHFTKFQFLSLREKFNSEKDDSVVVISTKVRSLKRLYYNFIKTRFFDILNNSNKRFLLVGEKEIEYDKLYTVKDNSDEIYSIYSDIIHNIDSSRIIDMTIPGFGVTTPNLSNLINDLDVISKHRIVSVGSSGISFVYSCVSDIVGYQTPRYLTSFIDQDSKMFFDNSEVFLNSVNNFLK